VAYEQQYSLAQYFSEDPDDKWLSDHFYFNCMNVAIKVTDDGGRLRAEASINAGKVFESLGITLSVVELSVMCETVRRIVETSRVPVASLYY